MSKYFDRIRAPYCSRVHQISRNLHGDTVSILLCPLLLQQIPYYYVCAQDSAITSKQPTLSM